MNFSQISYNNLQSSLPTDGESGWHLQSLARSSDTESLQLQEMVLSEMVRWWLPTQHFEGLSYIQMAELGYITKGSSCRATLSCTLRAALPFICTKVINLLANSRVWHLSGLSPSANHSRGNNCFNFSSPAPSHVSCGPPLDPEEFHIFHISHFPSWPTFPVPVKLCRYDSVWL